MSTLTIEIPEGQLEALERVARQRGVSVTDIVAGVVGEIAAGADDVARDPLFNIKSHETDAPADLSRNADHYLYEADRQ